MITVAMYPVPSSRDKNPFVSLFVSGLLDVGVKTCNVYACFVSGPKSLHVHWLEQVTWGRLTSLLPIIALLKAKIIVFAAKIMTKRKVPIVWTIHNLNPHEALKGYKAKAFFIMKSEFLPLVTDAVAMSNSAIPLIREQYTEIASARIHVVPHMNYRRYYSSLGVSLDRDTVENTVPRIVMAGLLRPYKGIVEAINIMKTCKADFDFKVIGRGSASYIDAIRAAADGDRRFNLQFVSLPDKEFAEALSDADVALFNFSSILNSGSVIAALSVGTPVFCPADGALAELSNTVGKSWIGLFEPPFQSESVLQFIRATSQIDRQNPPIDFLSPSCMALAYSRIYGHA